MPMHHPADQPALARFPTTRTPLTACLILIAGIVVPATAGPAAPNLLASAVVVGRDRARGRPRPDCRRREPARGGGARGRRADAALAEPLPGAAVRELGQRPAPAPRCVRRCSRSPSRSPGTRAGRLALSAADRAEAEAARRQWRQLAILEVGRLYLRTAAAREALAFIGEQRDGLREIVAALDRRLKEGVAAEADVRKFETELALVETELAASASSTSLAGWASWAPCWPCRTCRRPALAPARACRTHRAGRPAAGCRDRTAARCRSRRARAESAPGAWRTWSVPAAARISTLSGGYKRTADANTGVIAVLLPIPLTDRNRPAVARAVAETRAADVELAGVRALARAEVVALVTRAQALARPGRARRALPWSNRRRSSAARRGRRSAKGRSMRCAWWTRSAPGPRRDGRSSGYMSRPCSPTSRRRSRWERRCARDESLRADRPAGRAHRRNRRDRIHPWPRTARATRRERRPRPRRSATASRCRRRRWPTRGSRSNPPRRCPRTDTLDASGVLALDETRTARDRLDRGGHGRRHARGGRRPRPRRHAARRAAQPRRARHVGRVSTGHRRAAPARDGAGLRARRRGPRRPAARRQGHLDPGAGARRRESGRRRGAARHGAAPRCGAARRPSSTSASPTRRTPPARAASAFPCDRPSPASCSSARSRRARQSRRAHRSSCVSDLGALWALAEVDERHLGAFRVGRDVAVRVSAFAERVVPRDVSPSSATR